MESVAQLLLLLREVLVLSQHLIASFLVTHAILPVCLALFRVRHLRRETMITAADGIIVRRVLSKSLSVVRPELADGARPLSLVEGILSVALHLTHVELLRRIV